MEEITLEKIDIIRQRTGVSYAEAKEALLNNNGNVVDTLIYLEKNQKTFTQNISEVSNELIDTIKDIIKKGNVSRIKVKKDNRLLVDIPVSAGIAAGAISLFYPSLLVIGAVTALATKITIEIERPDGRIEVINKIAKDTYEDIKEKVNGTREKAMNIVNDITEDFKNTANKEEKNKE